MAVIRASRLLFACRTLPKTKGSRYGKVPGAVASRKHLDCLQ
jgi:hypothetical protein